MAYPPTIPPADVTNTTPQVDRHPADHNEITNALRDLVNVLGNNPQGDYSTVQERQDNSDPIGVVKMTVAAVAPYGYLVCNGQAIPAGAQYNALRTLLGGTTVPDLRDKFLIGAGLSVAVKAVAGTNALVLGVNNLPSHNHPGSVTGGESNDHVHGLASGVASGAGGHNHNLGSEGLIYNSGVYGAASPSTGEVGYWRISGAFVAAPDHTHPLAGNTQGRNAGHTHGVNVAGQGGGVAIDNRPSCYGLTPIIKAF